MKISSPYLKINDNLIRHHILSLVVIYTIANKLPQGTVFTLKEIEDISKVSKKKHNAAITYLLATGNLLPYPYNGLATGIILSPKGKDAYYSEHFKEIGNKEIGRFWNVTITLIFSGLLTITAIIPFFSKETKSSSIKMQEIELKVQEQSKILDSIKHILHQKGDDTLHNH